MFQAPSKNTVFYFNWRKKAACYWWIWTWWNDSKYEAAKNVAKLLNTTVGYLLGETEQTNLLSDPEMLKRLNDIANLPNTDKEHILYTIDNLLASVKTRLAYSA